MRRSTPVNYALLFPYAAPYFAYVFSLTLIPALLPASLANLATSVAYVVAGGAAMAGLIWAWRWTLPLRGEGSVSASVAVGIAGGLLGTVLWLVAKAPFYEAGGEAWDPGGFWLRFVISATVVAIFEELVFRGFVMRAACQWSELKRRGDPHPLATALHERSVNQVSPSDWNVWAVLVSSLLFAAGHAPREVPAAFIFGLWMAVLTIYRKDLLTAVVAHGTTNAVLAFYVRASGNWNYW